MFGKNETLEKFCDLYKGEVAACETYQQAINAADDESSRMVLRELKMDHDQNCQLLRQQIVSLGGEVPQGSGAWGVWANAITGAARLTGITTTLKVLREGEEHGIKEYEEALQERDIPEYFRATVQRMLPRQRSHIRTLDQFMNRM